MEKQTELKALWRQCTFAGLFFFFQYFFVWKAKVDKRKPQIGSVTEKILLR